MVAVEMDMVVITGLMVILRQEQVTSVAHNLLHITNVTMHTDTSHIAAWGAGGNGAREGNRGARGREGVVVVTNITDKYNVRRFINVCFKSY